MTAFSRNGHRDPKVNHKCLKDNQPVEPLFLIFFDYIN
jgi:hypothetical protein